MEKITKGKGMDYNIPEGMKKIVKKDKIKLVRKRLSRDKGKLKYSKQQLLLCFEGYDILENMIVVRTYIQKKYKMNIHLLELLLYLFPKKYFSYYDYFEMPKSFTYNSIRKMIEDGYVSEVSKGKTKRDSYFTLTTHARGIVVTFYKLLSGEMEMPRDYRMNPLALKTKSTAFDRMKFDIVKKLSAKEPSEAKKALFK